MNKKITIYELVGKIKNGQAPERILYDSYIWTWTGDDYCTKIEDKKEQFLITGMYYTWLTEFLNSKVEILDNEDEDIEEMTMCTSGIMGFDAVEHITTELKDKLNILVREVNKLKKIAYFKSKGE